MEVTGIYGTNLYERLKSDGYHVVMIFPIPLKITETTNDLIKQIKLILPVLPNFFWTAMLKSFMQKKRIYWFESLHSQKECT